MILYVHVVDNYCRFKENSGRYVVNIRLTETQAQTLVFRYNKLIDNIITMSETVLKPRSRARAVIVISSRYVCS